MLTKTGVVRQKKEGKFTRKATGETVKTYTLLILGDKDADSLAVDVSKDLYNEAVEGEEITVEVKESHYPQSAFVKFTAIEEE